MTPTVQYLYSRDRANAWLWFFIGQMIGVGFFLVTGWWVVILVNAILSWFEFQSIRLQHVKRLSMEMEIIIQLRAGEYDKVRTALAQFEDEAEHNPNRLERYRGMKFAEEFRSIMEDVKKEIDKHELKKN